MNKSYKSVPCVGTVASVEDAFSALEELGSECREVVDNTGDSGLSQTQRIQTFDETASTLEGLSAPDVPECVAELEIRYSDSVPKSKRRSPSRAARCANACAVLAAAAEAAQQWLDDEANAEHDDRDEVEQFISDLESAVGEAEGCEFPGLYG